MENFLPAQQAIELTLKIEQFQERHGEQWNKRGIILESETLPESNQ